MVPRYITNGTEDLKSVTKFMKSLNKSEQATQKNTSYGAPLKNSNQVPPSSNKKQKTRAPFVGPHKKNMCTKETCQDKPPHECINFYYNSNGNNYRLDFTQGGGGGRGYQGGRVYHGQGREDERGYHNGRGGHGPGRVNYQGTSGNQGGSNYQGNNIGGQNKNDNHKNNGNNGQYYNRGPPGNSVNNQYQGSNQYSNQGSNQGSIN